MIPLNSDKKFNHKSESFFITHAIGVATNRDSWAVNFSKKALSNNMESLIEVYNQERKKYQNALRENPKANLEDVINQNPRLISWSAILKNRLVKNEEIHFNDDNIREYHYRPFSKSRIYFKKELNEAIGLSPKLFPTSKHKNLTICVSGKGSKREFPV